MCARTYIHIYHIFSLPISFSQILLPTSLPIQLHVLSINQSINKSQNKKNSKTKKIAKQNRKNKNSIESNLCWPSYTGHEACPSDTSIEKLISSFLAPYQL